MREPPDPLRFSYEMNLDLDGEQTRTLKRLEAAHAAAVGRACRTASDEQAETATREQHEALEAIDDFWREVAAAQLDGVREELTAWREWKAAGGRRHQVRVEFTRGDIDRTDEPPDPADAWKRGRG